MQEIFQDAWVTYGIPSLITLVGAGLLVISRKVANALVNLVETKAGIEISDAMEMKIDNIIVRSVAAVEEYARTKVKADSAEKPDSESKLSLAMSKVKENLSKAGIEMDDSEISDRIHDTLNLSRNGEAGSLGE